MFSEYSGTWFFKINLKYYSTERKKIFGKIILLYRCENNFCVRVLQIAFMISFGIG